VNVHRGAVWRQGKKALGHGCRLLGSCVALRGRRGNIHALSFNKEQILNAIYEPCEFLSSRLGLCKYHSIYEIISLEQ
jgi:hypothetical protein